jgi:predicted Zn finger-like uncharacterized protein
MSDNVIHCPECQRQLKVPEEMLGRLVKCPTCGAMFTVAAASATGDAPPVVAAATPAPAATLAEPVEPDAAVDQVAAAIKLPGTFLLLVGSLGLIVNAFDFLRNVIGGEARAQEAVQQLQEVYQRLGMQVEPGMVATAWKLALVLQAIIVLVGLLTVSGALRMLQLRNYGLALTASILAMLNFGNCCCVLGIPFGIWALIVLLRPEVRAAFE